MKHWKTPAHVLAAAALLGAFSACADSTEPEVPDPRLFVDLSAGGDHTCGVTTDGRLLCWGANRYGQLGDGTTVDRHAPTPVSGLSDFTRVSAGGGTTCALTAEDVAYCWGDNEGGTLGVASPEQTVTDPRAVATEQRFVEIVSGGAHRCALTDGGTAYCWGINDFGQLGSDHTDPECGGACARAPQLVPGDVRFSSLSAGGLHTCGVSDDGDIYCWGLNESAQLGAVSAGECDPWQQGPMACSSSPLKVIGSQAWAEVAAALHHTCALTPTGTAECWGMTGWRLGDGVDAPQEPMRARPGQVSGGIPFEHLAAESAYTCGVSVGGGIFCWGHGELGNSEGAASGVPRRVDTPAHFITVTAGDSHACGLTPEGIAYCWGENRYGQLGDPSGVLGWLTPIAVKGW